MGYARRTLQAVSDRIGELAQITDPVDLAKALAILADSTNGVSGVLAKARHYAIAEIYQREGTQQRVADLIGIAQPLIGRALRRRVAELSDSEPEWLTR